VNGLNQLALLASFLIGLSSTTLRFVEPWRVASIAAAVAGVALGAFCIRAGRAQTYSRPTTSFVSQYPRAFTALALAAFGLSEFFAESILRLTGLGFGVVVSAVVVASTATLYLTWLHLRKLPNERIA